jgi:hypothetical protein
MDATLLKYLKKVLAKANDVPVSALPPLPDLVLAPASEDQVGRIVGDWLRMRGNALRQEDPVAADQFLAGAGRILLWTYRVDNGISPRATPAPPEPTTGELTPPALAGATEPAPFVISASHIPDRRLLGVFGLYEYDRGNRGKARELLEAAVKAGPARSQVYVTLSRLRHDEAKAQPEGGEGRFSALQTASIVEPLHAALRLTTSAEVLRLLIEAWANSETKPSDRDIETCCNGALQFPRDTRLTYLTALLCAQSGFVPPARKLIAQGLVFSDTDETRQFFLGLSKALDESQLRPEKR